MRTMLMPKTRLALLPLVAATLLFTAACGEDPTEPTPITEQIIDVEVRTLDPGGTATILISLSETSTLQAMLAGVVLDNPVRSITPGLRLRLSRLSGTDCVPFMEIDAQPRLTASLQQLLEPASYCVTVIDPGTLPQTATVALRLASPALVALDGEPGTATFESTLMPSGTATRTFRASTNGQVNVTLASLTGDPVDVVLGVGLYDEDTTTCRVAQTVVARPGAAPQFSQAVDAGQYCVMLFETGMTTGPQSFSVTVQHP